MGWTFLSVQRACLLTDNPRRQGGVRRPHLVLQRHRLGAQHLEVVLAAQQLPGEADVAAEQLALLLAPPRRRTPH